MRDRVTLDRFDLRPKLILAFVLVAMLVGVTGFVGYTSVSTVDAELESIKQEFDDEGANGDDRTDEQS